MHSIVGDNLLSCREIRVPVILCVFGVLCIALCVCHELLKDFVFVPASL